MEIKFGKHKGKKLTEIPADYLHWLIENSDTSDPKYGDANKKMVKACQDELNRRTDSGVVEHKEAREVKVSSFDPAVLAMLSKMLNTISADVKEIKEKLAKEDVPF